MPAPMVKTSTPGIYKRGARYVVVYRDAGGRQRKESARTLDEARKLKAARTADIARGEFHPLSRERFREYAEAWVERYQGTGRRGFRESTREDYRRLLREFAFPFFDDKRRRRLGEVTPADVAEFIGWLCDEQAQGRALSDSTVRNILNPVRSCFATAVREGKVRSNPCAGAALPHRQQVQDNDGEEVRALSAEQLATVLAVVHPRHRLMFRFLAATGLRVSELVALQWRHLRLDGSEPCVRVRRALVRGREQPPKSRHGRRDVPLSPTLVDDLRAARRESEWPCDEDLVFPSLNGTPLLVENLRRRVLRPAAEEAGAPWAGFHTFRHTCASMLFERGRNVKQVQRWLGHHSPSFTLETYVHLLDDGLPEPLDVDGRDSLPAGFLAVAP
jgi:integrase